MTADRSLPTRSKSIAEAAQTLGVNPNTVRTWLREGHLLSLEPADVEALRVRLDADWDQSGRRLA